MRNFNFKNNKNIKFKTLDPQVNAKHSLKN